ncbi:hypothetical protein [Caldibacillus debilis]|uniref:Uncharacterized protein n=1 Tax=Caldibacillus debilis GB1 TaxID=1339248 RepID=A0A420VDQ2_9BACI|nr:hypothetical protein [Caldibacillus debilis]RKO61817.1 hypothetical protein Cdeb_01312 [Caldibacillus debilis GB1]
MSLDQLLAGLEKEGVKVTVENIDRYLHQAGVIVKVHIGRIRGSIELSPKLLGLKMTEGVKAFFDKHAKNGTLNFLDNETLAELERIENRVRMAKTRMSIGYDNSYMPIETYRQFAEYLETQRAAYFAKRDEILSRWENLKQDFMTQLNHVLRDLHSDPEDIEKIHQAVMKKYPSKEEFRDSFYMRASLRAFPVTQNIHLFDEDISEQVKESAIKENLKLVREAVGICLNDLFQAANKVHQSLDEKRKLEARTKGSVLKTIKTVRINNIMKHPTVEELTIKLEKLVATQDVDDGLEMAETIMSVAYGQAKELDLMEYMDLRESNIPEDDLEVLYISHAA